MVSSDDDNIKQESPKLRNSKTRFKINKMPSQLKIEDKSTTEDMKVAGGSFGGNQRSIDISASNNPFKVKFINEFNQSRNSQINKDIPVSSRSKDRAISNAISNSKDRSLCTSVDIISTVHQDSQKGRPIVPPIKDLNQLLITDVYKRQSLHMIDREEEKKKEERSKMKSVFDRLSIPKKTLNDYLYEEKELEVEDGRGVLVKKKCIVTPRMM